MPVYQAPGVYVEEVPGSPPIVGVGTSTSAFMGVVADDVEMPFKPGSTTDKFTLTPVGTPILVTNFDQFKTKFGKFDDGNKILAHAVYGFFLNGGKRCYVIRVADLTAAPTAALAELAKIDEIALVAAPGAVAEAFQEAVIDDCEKLGDRFAILDGQQTTTIDTGHIKGTTKDSDYAALYFPWIKVFNQIVAAQGDPPTPQPLILPPSGHLAGIYARVDATRGVHKAPANEGVRGALDLEYLVTHEDQEGLNPDGINVIRSFKGNLKVWGARTLGGNANGEFKYINVRRLFLFLRESIDEGTQFAVFEPNAQPLWQKIRRSVGDFLTNVWRDGALFGETPEQAFFVRCDETTNPPAVRDAGQVVTEIGVAVVKPAEFVIFRISQVSGSAS